MDIIQTLEKELDKFEIRLMLGGEYDQGGLAVLVSGSKRPGARCCVFLCFSDFI